jgi:hypothetical protein
MKVRFHPHAVERLRERGTTEEEVKRAVETVNCGKAWPNGIPTKLPVWRHVE